MTARLYVSGLAPDCKPAALRERFAAVAGVQSAKVRKKGGLAYGFVAVDAADVGAALALHNTLWEGARLGVERARDDAGEEPPLKRSRAAEPAVVKAAEPVERRAKSPDPLPAPSKAADRPAKALELAAKQSVSARPIPPAAQPSAREAPPAARPKLSKEAKKVAAAQKKREAAMPPGQLRDRKVRAVPVPAVAKATAWDAVLGHAWDRQPAAQQGFSLLAAVEPAPPAAPATAARYEPVATRYALAHLERVSGAQALRALEAKMAQRASAGNGALLPGAGVAAEYGALFVARKDTLHATAEQWRAGELRQDFKKKRSRALRRAQRQSK